MRLIAPLLLLAACTGAAENPSVLDPDDSPKQVSPLGEGDGSSESVSWTYIIGPDEKLDDPRDLGFDTSGNLWIANREDDRTFIVSDPGTDQQDSDRRIDGYAEHFMEEISAMEFDTGSQFGTCGESMNTYNDKGPPNSYMGPVLWTTDLNIFGVENPIGLGSHLDMSHESPNCVGIGWEADNIYWVFDGKHKALVRHDFQRDHGVGMDEHFDGIIHELTEPEMTMVDEAPGHVVIDREAGILYAADTGGGRVLWVKLGTGEKGDQLRANDPGVERNEWDGAEWGVVIEGLDNPGALARYGDRLIIGEWGSGRLIEVDLEGEILRELDTDFGEEALYGIELGPDGKLWVLDVNTGAWRIDP